MSRPLTFGALLLLILPAVNAQASRREVARDALRRGDADAAALAYSAIAEGSQDAALVSEYAFALALGGHAEPALALIDRAVAVDRTSPEVLFFESELLGAAGLQEAASELAQPPPAWIGTAPKLPMLESTRSQDDFEEEAVAANAVLKMGYLASAAYRYNRLASRYPQESIGWSGLSLALQQLGCFKASAKASRRELAVIPNEDASVREVLAIQAEAVESQPPVPAAKKQAANDALAGRYLAFFGTGLTHSQGANILNLNFRLGKFLTERFDAGVSGGITSGYADSDYNGFNLGFSGRLNSPLPVRYPLSVTGAARIEYVPSPADENLALVLTPGISWFLADGSIDLTLDLAVRGPAAGTRTLALGYTAYFGGKKR